MDKELIITKEDVELLKEMKENCLKSSVYDDEKRLLKANAITKFLNLLDTYKKQQEVIDKATNDLQQVMANVNNKTIISLGQFVPKLEIIQDELGGSNDILKEAQNEKN